MDLGLWPEAVPYDPDDGAGSEELDRQLAETSFPGAALVVAGRGLQEPEWARRAAIGLARAIAATGRDVLLADLNFESPSLHELLSESAVEGLADVLLFGASLERVTVLPAGQSFEFVAAGGYAPDPEELRGERAWVRLLEGLAARGTVFLGYTESDVAGLDRLVERIPDIVLLSPPDDTAQTVARLPDQIRIQAMIQPPQRDVTDAGLAAATEAAAAGEPAVETSEEPLAQADVAGDDDTGLELGEAMGDGSPEVAAAAAPAGTRDVSLPEPGVEPVRLPKDEAREALIADLEARERVERAEAGSGDDRSPEAATAGAGFDAFAREVASRARPRRQLERRLAAAAVIVAMGGTVWYLGFRRQADLSEPVEAPPQVATVQVVPEPVGDPLAWSVAIEAHDRIEAANQRAAALSDADPSLAFFVAPAVVNDGLWYRVLAGPLSDSVGAVQAMQRLVGSGLKRAAAIWDVRQTNLTFLLGRFPLELDANDRLRELRDLGIPAYVIEVPYSHGEPWYHVYGGAYSSPVEADAMRQMLRDAGLPDSLIVRTGRIAS